SSIVAAYALDAAVGDPEDYPHPVRLMGKLVESIEGSAKRLGESALIGKLAGAAITSVLVGTAYLAARVLLALPGGRATEVLLIYTTIARKDLARSALRVARALEEGDVGRARTEVASLVGRDTGNLDECAVARATVESVAENLVDGVLSPLQWAAVGGAPAAVAFKAVSTLDSMVGHRGRGHINVGWFSARLDDIANFLAARAAVPLIAAASVLCGLDGTAAVRIGMRDRLKHESPNSAHAEAAFAGALGLGLGGPSRYEGEVRELPEIGEGTRDAGPDHIREAVMLMNIASAIGLAVSAGLARREGR
ncbi:MAG: adenosylcobinamide-phosphate synthase CbiB, partial [Longimicrobiales bacterium]|nr:adenosylcobinamide-phosphate synthase CbiB [Longimicrobiales bacterium]